MSTPFSITLFSTTGDPNGIRRVDKSNWSGFGVVFSKDQLADLKGHSSFRQAGIYILVGNAAEETTAGRLSKSMPGRRTTSLSVTSINAHKRL